MDLNKISFFAMAKKRLSWLTQRQEVLAHNVANADTPKFKSRDLEPFKFERMVRRESMQLNMEVTHGDHAAGRRKRIRDYAEETDRRPFETSPADNAIVLEEQMAKIHETNASHKLTTKLYTKQLSLIALAVKSR